jgi:hypothetical protein
VKTELANSSALGWRLDPDQRRDLGHKQSYGYGWDRLGICGFCCDAGAIHRHDRHHRVLIVVGDDVLETDSGHAAGLGFMIGTIVYSDSVNDRILIVLAFAASSITIVLVIFALFAH